jgi:hypothetical protein
VMVGAEFDPLWENIDNVETIGIPNNCQQQFCRLNSVSFSLGNFYQVATRWTGDLYSEQATTHQGLWCHASVCPVGSLIQIEVLAKFRPDVTFERLTVNEGPIRYDGSRTPTTMLNAGDCGSWQVSSSR